MFGAGLGFVFACCILVRLPIALEPHTLAAVLPLALCGLWFRHSRVVAGFALGIALTAGAIDHDLGLRLKGFSATTGMTGRICSLPVVRDGFTRFMYCPTGGSPGGARYRLSWYRPAVELLPGQEWRLAVKLGPPTGSVNFDLFDFERWQFVKRIHGRGYVRTDQKPEFIGLDGEFVDRVRFHLRENLRRRVPASELGTFLALALGDTSLLDANRWEVLNSTGTTHLLIVSGLHTGLIATLVFNLLRLIGVPLSILIGATIGITGCYALIAGWGLPVQRALIMTTTVLLCIGAARQIKPGAQVLVALVAVLGFDPLASLSNGFWLSFGAVLALLYGLHGRTGMTGGVAEWIQSTTKAQWVVFVALMPGLAHLMGQLPLGSLLTN
ncbi:MAG: ComEC/Rec2 family competence protein, partial [Gammaproteobacteria bacterium]|nr:ComEC/Rec2 family competence protein [Gammaproteobacteria bacterium]